MKCNCGEDLHVETRDGRIMESTTLVGYLSPVGHNHDDNCLKRSYVCSNGHYQTLSKRRRCQVCDWVGKEECFCHSGKKVDEWPEAEAVVV